MEIGLAAEVLGERIEGPNRWIQQYRAAAEFFRERQRIKPAQGAADNGEFFHGNACTKLFQPGERDLRVKTQIGRAIVDIDSPLAEIVAQLSGLAGARSALEAARIDD